ncbi:hypothetical protein [Teredinibacter purpureus]|uniref:hypothetical protein n=1 Tax=Teredinibacter purpureus TaxID=2731756 RepID=UPI000ADED3B8|nr:hypothetical protein [Teredinibacter purpureus]
MKHYPITHHRSARSIRFALIGGCLLSILSVSANAQHVYYRYINKDGVKVLDHSIPPEYAQSGYEVINASGKVVKVVAPAPSAEEISRNAKEREILETYARLKRRYSSTDAMEAYKQRQLKSINNNISTLKGIIRGLQEQINTTTSKAADYERRGVDVPSLILSKLNDLHAELAISNELLAYRQKEYQDVTHKFDSDILAYLRGEALEEMSREKIN